MGFFMSSGVPWYQKSDPQHGQIESFFKALTCGAKNDILWGINFASPAREGGNDPIWWLHVFFWGRSTKDLEDLEVKIPTRSWFFVFATNGWLRWKSMKLSQSCETSSFHMEKHNFLQMEAQTYFYVLVWIFLILTRIPRSNDPIWLPSLKLI